MGPLIFKEETSCFSGMFSGRRDERKSHLRINFTIASVNIQKRLVSLVAVNHSFSSHLLWSQYWKKKSILNTKNRAKCSLWVLSESAHQNMFVFQASSAIKSNSGSLVKHPFPNKSDGHPETNCICFHRNDRSEFHFTRNLRHNAIRETSVFGYQLPAQSYIICETDYTKKIY